MQFPSECRPPKGVASCGSRLDRRRHEGDDYVQVCCFDGIKRNRERGRGKEGGEAEDADDGTAVACRSSVGRRSWNDGDGNVKVSG